MKHCTQFKKIKHDQIRDHAPFEHIYEKELHDQRIPKDLNQFETNIQSEHIFLVHIISRRVAQI